MYDMLAELKNQEKHITMCKVTAHIGINGNKAVKISNTHGRSSHFKTAFNRLLLTLKEV